MYIHVDIGRVRYSSMFVVYMYLFCVSRIIYQSLFFHAIDSILLKYFSISINFIRHFFLRKS